MNPSHLGDAQTPKVRRSLKICLHEMHLKPLGVEIRAPVREQLRRFSSTEKHQGSE